VHDNNLIYEIICNEIKKHEEDSNYNRLAHFAVAKKYAKNHKIFIISQAIATAIILTLLLSPLDKIFNPSLVEVIKIFLSLCIAIYSALGAHLNFHELSITNHNVAQKYQTLWRNCDNWKTDFPDESNIEEAIKRTQFFRDRINEINRESPQIPDWAHDQVKKYMDQGMDKYDFEIADIELDNVIDPGKNEGNRKTLAGQNSSSNRLKIENVVDQSNPIKQSDA